MPDDPNMTWLPGAPAPWLGAYGPPPVDSSLIGAPSAPPPVASPADATPAPPPDAAPSPPPPIVDSFAGAPTPGAPPPFPAATPAPEGATAAPPFVPPWIQSPATHAAPTPTTASPSESADQRLGRMAADPDVPLEVRQKAFADMSPQQRAQVVNNADPKQLAAIANANATMTPEDLVTIRGRLAKAQIHEQSAQQLELSRQREEQAQRDFTAYQTAVQGANDSTAQLANDAKALSMQKIDPNEHGVGNFVASVITSAIGGAMSQYTGGRNLALEELDKRTQRRIDAQKADIANQWQGIGFKRNLIGEQLQRSGDLYKAQETYRISQYDRAIADLQTKMQDYAADGTTALNTAEAVQQIQAKRQAALQAYHQQEIKNGLDLAKVQTEAATQSEVARHNKAQEGIESWKASIEADKAKTEKAANVVWQPEQLAQLYGKDAPVPPIAMSAKDYGQWLENRNKGQENIGKQQENAEKENSNVVRNPETKERLIDENGNAIRVSTAVAEKLNERVAYAQSAVDQLSKIRRYLESDPSATDRAGWAGNETQYELAKQAYVKSLGANPSSRELAAQEEAFGPNFASFTDRVIGKGKGKARIDTIIDTIRASTDTEVGAATGYKGKSLIKDTSLPPPTAETDADRLTQHLAKNLYNASDSELTDSDRAYFAITSGTAPARRDAQEKSGDDPLVQRAIAANVTPSKIDAFDKLEDMARYGKTSKDRDAAIAAIHTAAQDGTSQALRDYARSVESGLLIRNLGNDGGGE